MIRGRFLRRPLRATASVFGAVAGAVSLAALAIIGIGPFTGRERPLTVLTGSMGSTVPAGSIAIETPEPASAVAVGQIVSFQAPTGAHQIETHRVLRVVQSGAQPIIQTKGDANSQPDPWLARLDGTQVWRVRHVVPFAGWAVNWLRRPIVHRIATLAAPATLALLWLSAIWGRRRPRLVASPTAVASG
ncbi:MAG: S24/S26 family peptidase [Acidimicrobiales bacterium]